MSNLKSIIGNFSKKRDMCYLKKPTVEENGARVGRGEQWGRHWEEGREGRHGLGCKSKTK